MNCPNCNTEMPTKTGFKGELYYRCQTCAFGTPVDNKQTVIREMYAYVAEMPDGSEGLMAFNVDGVMMGAVCTDQNMLETLTPEVITAAKTSKLKVKLLKFTARELVKTYGYD